MKIHTLTKYLQRSFCHNWTIYGGHASFTNAENLQYRNINDLGFSISRATSYRILEKEIDAFNKNKGHRTKPGITELIMIFNEMTLKTVDAEPEFIVGNTFKFRPAWYEEC